jgi:hypothetical protein
MLSTLASEPDTTSHKGCNPNVRRAAALLLIYILQLKIGVRSEANTVPQNLLPFCFQ